MKTTLLLICLLPGIASAGSLYRCVTQAGHVSYQSASCERDQRTDRTVEFVAEPVSAPSKTGRADVSRRSAASSRLRQRVVANDNPKSSTCKRAKADREVQLQRLGLKRTFDDLSRIDAAVRTVCHGY